MGEVDPCSGPSMRVPDKCRRWVASLLWAARRVMTSTISRFFSRCSLWLLLRSMNCAGRGDAGQRGERLEAESEWSELG